MNIQNFLSILLTAGFIAALGFWMVHPPGEFSPTAGTVINMLLGALVAKFTTVVDFHFGSSKQSAMKDETISNMAANTANPAPGNGSKPTGQP